MRHEWVFDVLRDMKAYAQANGLPALAAKADEALRVARAEIISLPAAEPGAESGGEAEISGRRVPGRAH